MTNFKRFLTLLFVTILTMHVWGAETVVYTLNGTTTGGSSGYDTESDITQSSISWKVMGNTTMNPWRIGGKSLTTIDRTVYSTTAITDDITKIEIQHGAASSVTVNSMTIVVSKNTDFSSPVSTLTPTFAASSTVTVERPSGNSWANCYYKIIYNITISSTSNKFIAFNNAKFYANASSSSTVETPTFSPAEGSYSSTQSVTISCATAGATIYYTTDGSTPSTSSSVYSSAISVSTTTTIKAIATKSGMDNSGVASATYTITGGGGGGGGSCSVFHETWDGCDGTGGNSGVWSGTVASSDAVVSDNSGWTYYTGYKGDQCIRTSKGGYAQTPSISVSSGTTYTLSYNAADWGTDGCTFALTATGATITAGSSSGTLSTGSWGSHSATLTATASTMQITFTASSGDRGWLDEICIDAAGPSYTVTATVDDAEHGSVSVSGNTITVTPNAGWVPDGYTVTSGTATAAQSGNIFTVTPSSDCSIQINFRTANTYTVTFYDNNTSYTETATEGSPFALPEEGLSSCPDATFLGWAEDTYTNHATGTSVAPTYTAKGEEVSISASKSFTAVYGNATLGDKYAAIKTEAGLTSGANYVIAAYYSSTDYAMKGTITYDDELDSESASYSINTPNTVTDNTLIWTINIINASNKTVTLYNAAANKYLSINSSNAIELADNPYIFKYEVDASGDAATWNFYSSTDASYMLSFYTTYHKYTIFTSNSSNIYLYKQTLDISSYTSHPQCCHAPATALAIESDQTTFVANGVAHLTLNSEEGGGNGKNITWSTTGGTLSDKTNSGATLTLTTPGTYTVTAEQADDETDPDNVICGATVTINITVKAQWTITFKTIDNSVESTYNSIVVTDGDTYTLPDLSEEYACTEGSSFIGWATNSSATSVEQTAGSVVTASENTTWYALWSEGSVSGETVYLFEQITSVSNLAAGDKVIFVNKSKEYGLAEQADNNRRADGVIVNPDNSDQIYHLSSSKVEELTVGKENDYFTFSTTAGYLYAASSSQNYLRTKSTLDANGKWEMVISAGEVTLTAQGENTRNILRYNSGSQLFSCYSSGQQSFTIWKKTTATKYVITASSGTVTSNNTNCTSGAIIRANTDQWITAANGQKVKRVYTVIAQGFESAATLAISGNTDSHFTATLGATAIPAAPGRLETTLTVEYLPTGADETNDTKITLTAGDVTKNITINGRSLPDEFLMITKKTLWYALPANMTDGSKQYEGIAVTTDDPTEPSMVPIAPSTIIYNLKSVAAGRYESAGHCVRLAGNNNLCLWSNKATSSPAMTGIQNKSKLAETNEDNYDWLLNTTDGVHYTIANPNHPHYGEGRVLAYGDKFGMLKEPTVFFLVPAGCSTQPQDVVVTPKRVEATFSWVSNASSVTIDVYTNETKTEGHISATATSSPYLFSGLAQETKYWFTLTPNDEGACAVSGTFTTTGPVIDVVEWEENAAVVFVDKDEALDPKVIIDGEVEHGVGTGATATELFFSKYFEGAGDMKLVAIFNGTANDISLTGYNMYTKNCSAPKKEADIATSSFGSQTNYAISTLGTIKAGQEIIFFTRPAADSELESMQALHACSEDFLDDRATNHSGANDNPRWVECGGESSFPAMSFNGNDAICLEKNNDLIDVIGATGTPGKEKNCANRLNDLGWSITVKNIDKGKASNDASFDDLFAASSLSPSNDTERRAVLAGFNIDLDNDYIDLTTARCILFRDKRVTSGDSAVAMNTGAQFVTCTTHTEGGVDYTSEWNGRLVCMSSANQTAAGVANDSRATCNSYQDLGKFDYSEYYKDWFNINPGEELSEYVRDADTKTYEIPINEMYKYSCLSVKFQLTDPSDSHVITETAVQVPIVVTGNKSTNNAIFNTIVKTDGGDPMYDQSIERCKTCNVVVLGTGVLTKAADDATHDVPEIGNLKIYPGGKLIVPASTNYTVNSLSFRRQEDEIASADIQGSLNFKAPNSTYLDLRIDPSNWHYFTLPYDVNVSDISFLSEETVPSVLGTDYFIQWYDGAYRAEHKTGGWTNITNSDFVLKKGLGYIIGLSGSGKVKRELRFPMSNDVVTDDTKDKTISSVYGYGCDKDDETLRPNHKGWNLIGAPYLTAYTSDITSPLRTGLLIEDHSTDPWDGQWTENGNGIRYIVEPINNGWDGYRQVAIADYEMKPFTCYFVQVGGSAPEEAQTITFDKDQVARASVVRRRMPMDEEDIHPVWCALDITNANGESDETTMLISDRFTDGYDMMDDLVKMRGDYYNYYTKPVLASRNAIEELAFNALPDLSAETGIPLHYYAATNSSYTISYNDKFGREEIKEVNLWDAQTNQWYDLLNEAYTFSSNRTDDKNRFTVSIKVERKKTPQIATDFDNVSDSERPRKILINGNVYILRGGAVYDLTGKQMLNQ